MRSGQFEQVAGVVQALTLGPVMSLGLVAAALVTVFLGVWWGIGDELLTGPSLDFERWLSDPDTETALQELASFDVASLVAMIPPWLLYASTWVQNFAMLAPAAGMAALVVLARRRFVDRVTASDGEPAMVEGFGQGMTAAFGLRSVSARWLVLGTVGGLAVSWFPSLLLAGLQEIVELDNTTGEMLADAVARSSGPELGFGILSIALAVPLFEELLFRGFIWSVFERWTHPIVPFAATTVGFALLHGSPLHILGVLTIGAWLGWLRWRSGSVWPSVCSHIANNGLAIAIIVLIGADDGLVTALNVGLGLLAAGLMAWLAVLAWRWSSAGRSTNE